MRWRKIDEAYKTIQHNKSCLVYCAGNRCIYTAYYDENHIWKHFCSGDSLNEFYKITHFMELPYAPYELQEFVKC